MFTLIPKNSGLSEYKKLALRKFKYLRTAENTILVRGEDIPSWIESFASKGRLAFGITGEDLYKDYQLKNPKSSVEIIDRFEWKDPAAIFNKPALCLLDRKDKKCIWNQHLTISIPNKYKNIAKQYLRRYELQGITFEKLYFNGSLEVSSFDDIADLIIDIVYTGGSMKQYNLEIIDVIMTSDIVILGGST